MNIERWERKLKYGKKSESGFTLLESIIALTIMTAVLSTGAIYLKNNADNVANYSAAESLSIITTAVQIYARDNYATLINSTETSVSLDTLADKKYIGENFSRKNSYGQNYSVTIKTEGTTGDEMLQIKVITQGGDAIKTANMRKIAALAGNDAGYATKTNEIIGNQEGWKINTTITTGRLASVGYISAKDLSSVVSAKDFLYRNKVDGHPEYNQMNTALDMNSNDIHFDDGAIIFNHNNFESMFSASSGTFIKGADKTEITADRIHVSNGDTNISGSTITAQAVKPSVTLIDNSYALFTTADKICDNETDGSVGKTFVIGVKSSTERYTFMCGKNDGTSTATNKGKAYYLFCMKGIQSSFVQTMVTFPGGSGIVKPPTHFGCKRLDDGDPSKVTLDFYGEFACDGTDHTVGIGTTLPAKLTLRNYDTVSAKVESWLTPSTVPTVRAQSTINGTKVCTYEPAL